MPHNHTRLYVGLAIAAVTIPAVAQLYYRTGTSPQNARREERTQATLARQESRKSDAFLASRHTRRGTERDYLAEVRAALATGNPAPVYAPETMVYPQMGMAPADAQGDSWSVDPYVAPEQMSLMQASPLDVTPYDDDYTDDDSGGYDDAGAPAPAVDISDDRLVQLVIQNLQDDQERANFRAAWATMSDDDRAALLDQWRSQLNGG